MNSFFSKLPTKMRIFDSTKPTLNEKYTWWSQAENTNFPLEKNCSNSMWIEHIKMGVCVHTQKGAA